MVKLIAKFIKNQIARSEGRSVWIALDSDAALGLRKCEDGLNAICILFGSRCKESKQIFDLFKGYSTGSNSRIVIPKNSKPKITQIVDLLFDDQNHVATVLGKLKERHFPPWNKANPPSHIYVPSPYIWEQDSWPNERRGKNNSQRRKRKQ